MAAITVEQLTDLLAKIPMACHLGMEVRQVRRGAVQFYMPFSDRITRPVDAVSGPAMMALADVALWAAVLTMHGPEEMVVTTNLNTHFLRRAEAVDIVAEARVLRMGRRLAVAAVELVAAGTDDVVAHATASYAMPA